MRYLLSLVPTVSESLKTKKKYLSLLYLSQFKKKHLKIINFFKTMISSMLWPNQSLLLYWQNLSPTTTDYQQRHMAKFISMHLTWWLKIGPALAQLTAPKDCCNAVNIRLAFTDYSHIRHSEFAKCLIDLSHLLLLLKISSVPLDKQKESTKSFSCSSHSSWTHKHRVWSDSLISLLCWWHL